MKSKINKKVIKNAIVALDDVISSESDSDLIHPPTGGGGVRKVTETFRSCSNCIYSEFDDPEHVHSDICNIRSSTKVKRRFVNKFSGVYENTSELRQIETWSKHKNSNGDCPYYDPGAAATHIKSIKRKLSFLISFFYDPIFLLFSFSIFITGLFFFLSRLDPWRYLCQNCLFSSLLQ